MLTSRTSLKSSRRILRPSSHSMKHILNTNTTNTTNMSIALSATFTLTGGAVHGTVELRGQHRPSEAPGGGQWEQDRTRAKRWTRFSHCVSGCAEVWDLGLVLGSSVSEQTPWPLNASWKYVMSMNVMTIRKLTFDSLIPAFSRSTFWPVLWMGASGGRPREVLRDWCTSTCPVHWFARDMQGRTGTDPEAGHLRHSF